MKRIDIKKINDMVHPLAAIFLILVSVAHLVQGDTHSFYYCFILAYVCLQGFILNLEIKQQGLENRLQNLKIMNMLLSVAGKKNED